MFGVTVADLRESNTAHVVNYMTLVMLLVEKGIVTDSDVESARLRATQLVDQAEAKMRDDLEK